LYLVCGSNNVPHDLGPKLRTITITTNRRRVVTVSTICTVIRADEMLARIIVPSANIPFPVGPNVVLTRGVTASSVDVEPWSDDGAVLSKLGCIRIVGILLQRLP
jgi:hypothetical protein